MVPPALLLMGPTASGKTGLSLALAARLGGEIVSVDSAQVYRGMDIGTAKPDAAQRAAVPHHLLDFVDPAEAYSAARFAADARAAVAAIRGRGRVPILAGGTMLYFRALTGGLSALPSADPATRAALESEARARGWPALHAELGRVDPASAARLHPNDQQRIQRALEIHRLTGQPASALQGQGRAPALDGAVVRVVLEPARALLEARIEERLDRMFAEGFIDEVARLRARGDLHLGLPSMRAVGYRQVWEHLDGLCGLSQTRVRALAATRQLAKRQRTWLRRESGAFRCDPAEPALVDKLLKFLDEASRRG